MDHSQTDLLLEVMRQRHACLSQLTALSRAQESLIAAGDLGQLMRVLSAKQRLLGELAGIERRLDPFRDQAPGERRWRSEDDRRRCAELAAQCQSLLSEVVRCEQQSEAALIRQRDEAAERLRTVDGAAQAHGAYLANDSVGSSTLDLTVER